MADPSEQSVPKRTVAKTSKSRPVFLAKNTKAARKVMDGQSPSDSSDSRSATSATLSGLNDQSDSVTRPKLNKGNMIHHPRQSNLDMGARKVTFENNDDSGSDDGTLRADQSPRRSPPGLQSEFPLPMERAGQVKRAMRRSKYLRSAPFDDGEKDSDVAQDLQHAAANFNSRPLKRTRHYDSNRVERTTWKSPGLSRKEFKGVQRRYSRMSVGSAIRQRSSRETNVDADAPDCHIENGTVLVPQAADASGPEDPYEPPGQYLITKAARKLDDQVGKKSSRPPSMPGQPPDIEEESSSSSGNEDEDLPQFTKPPESILKVLESISSATVQIHHMERLPFLRCNLQKGFLLTCQSLGVDIEDHPSPQSSISVVYSYKPPIPIPGNTRDHPTIIVKSLMKDWKCPFCNLYRKFPNSAILNKHLSWDHPSVDVLWTQDHTTLYLNIHDPESEFSIRSTPQLPVRESSVMDFTSNVAHLESVQGTDVDQKAPYIFSVTCSVESTGSKSSTPFSSRDELKCSTGKYEAAVGSGSRDTSVSAISQGQRGNARAGLAPMATLPYLPETNEGGIVHYSCRPGGPRLFDILNTQSLQPFGILKWVIVDREEELFELDDILDEDKMMQALWFRWIFINRNRFVANYFDGTKTFIKENWQLINQGAGLLALRAWLLVLAINKFLLATEVATLMRYYQELASIVAL